MFFKQISCGGDRNFGYILGDEAAGLSAVIDPSPNPDRVIRELDETGLKPVYLICTHDHYDHTGGNRKMKKRYGVMTVFHTSAGKGDRKVDDGDVLDVGSLSLHILHTPGHTADSISVLAENHLITGDFLFVGKVGGTPSRENARTQFDALLRVMAMDDAVSVWPGHDVGIRPASTIGDERRENPFCLRLDNFEEFYYLKENWAAYKREHGIA